MRPGGRRASEAAAGACQPTSPRLAAVWAKWPGARAVPKLLSGEAAQVGNAAGLNQEPQHDLEVLGVPDGPLAAREDSVEGEGEARDGGLARDAPPPVPSLV